MTTAATKGKPRARKVANAANRETVAAALRHYDRQFFGDLTTFKEAKEILKNDGVDTKGVKLGPLAVEVCEYWKTATNLRAASRARGHTGSQWHKLIAWCAEPGKIDPVRDTVASVARRVRYAGFITAEKFVIEAIAAARLPLPPRRIAAFKLEGTKGV